MLKNIGLTTNISKLPEENIQPNAVDLCIDRVWEIGNDEFYIGIDKKQHRKDTKEIFPDSTGEWLLEEGKKYQFDTSPTGAVNGKFEKEVDFNLTEGDTESVKFNLAYIDKLCGGDSAKEHRFND